MALTTWNDSDPKVWGSMPPNLGHGVEGNTWNVPAYDPALDPVPSQYWEMQGRCPQFVDKLDLHRPRVSTAYPAALNP